MYTAYTKFVNYSIEYELSVKEEFFETEAMKNDIWKRPNFENRHVLTRLSCHGFHFVICKNKMFHEANDECIM